MTCPATPGHCETCNRRVRWAELQTCREPAGSLVAALSCRDCLHRGEPVLAPSGKQVGTEGCGCTSESAPSGVLWWVCGITGGPVRESRANHCEAYERKVNDDAVEQFDTA